MYTIRVQLVEKWLRYCVVILKRSKGPLRINGDLVSLVLLTSFIGNSEIICCIYLLRGMHFKLFLLSMEPLYKVEMSVHLVPTRWD